MKGEKDALLMLAHRKETNEKRIPNGPGFTVTHGSAMGNQDGFSLFCDAGRKKTEATVVILKDTLQVPTGTLQCQEIKYMKVAINYSVPTEILSEHHEG